jgi:ribosomal protein S18 acetylase RimI-like enzyme
LTRAFGSFDGPKEQAYCIISLMKDSKNSFTYTTLYRGPEGIDLGAYRPGVFALEKEWDPYDPYLIESRPFRSEGSTAIVLACDEEKVIAFGTVDKEGQEANLYSAFVSKPYRRQGIYKRLVGERVEIARQMGVEKVTLNAIDTNMAKDWLIEYGFSVVGSSNNGHVDFEMAFQ